MKNTTKAFTLSELMIAVGILAFVFGALLLVFISCIILNESSRNFTVATSHAEYVLEQIKDRADTGFSALAGQINAGSWNWSGAPVSSNLVFLANETIGTSVSGTNPLTVGVTVRWNDRGGRNRNTTVQTLITQP